MPNDNRLKITPHSTESERAVLSRALTNERDMYQVVDALAGADFYEPVNQRIFEAIKSLSLGNKPVDILTVSEYLNRLRRNDTKENQEPINYKSVMLDYSDTPFIANLSYHITLIKEASTKRALLGASREIAGYAMGGDSLEEICDKSDAALFEVIGKNQTSQFTSLQDAQAKVLHNISERRGTTGLMGISSGYADVDKITDGFCKGQLIILAARAAMGKTAFALNLASGYINSLEDGAAHALIFSLEMTASELALRLLSAESMLPAKKLKRADLEPEDMERFLSAMQKTSSQKITIDDTGGLSISQLKTRARAVMRKNPYQLMVVDHLQIMDAGDHKNFINRTYEIQKITSALKALAKEMQIPIIALSQINRGVETRSDKRPMLSDLRDSGSIEQDADIVMMLYRDDYYTEGNMFPNAAELIFAKHRDGEQGMIPLWFRPEIMRFEAMQEYEAEQYRAHVAGNKHKEQPPKRTYPPKRDAATASRMPYKENTNEDVVPVNYSNPNF